MTNNYGLNAWNPIIFINNLRRHLRNFPFRFNLNRFLFLTFRKRSKNCSVGIHSLKRNCCSWHLNQIKWYLQSHLNQVKMWQNFNTEMFFYSSQFTANLCWTLQVKVYNTREVYKGEHHVTTGKMQSFETILYFFFFPPLDGLAYLAASWSKKSSAMAALWA